jgi:hypothetical protein
MICPTCSTPFAGKLLQKFCTTACQKAAANDRRESTGKRCGRPRKKPEMAAEAPSLVQTPQAAPATPIPAIVVVDGRTFHCVQIERSSATKYRALYDGRELGVWRDPEHSAARTLIDLGLAKRSDWLRTFHGETPCLKANIGWLADHSAADPDRGSPHWTKYKPFDRELEDDRAAA